MKLKSGYYINIMKKIYLMRHAKAGENPVDFNRPLADKGHMQCKIMSDVIVSNKLSPELVICSSAVRTRETLAGISSSISPKEILYEQDLYHASDAKMLAHTQNMSDSYNSVMIVAHNPGTQLLSLQLAKNPPSKIFNILKIEYPTAAICEFLFDCKFWKGVDYQMGELVNFWSPQDYAL